MQASISAALFSVVQTRHSDRLKMLCRTRYRDTKIRFISKIAIELSFPLIRNKSLTQYIYKGAMPRPSARGSHTRWGLRRDYRNLVLPLQSAVQRGWFEPRTSWHKWGVPHHCTKACPHTSQHVAARIYK